jgi:ABC-type Fe3+ transport system permease subunit
MLLFSCGTGVAELAGSIQSPIHGKENCQMKKPFSQLMTLAMTGALLLPFDALAAGEKATNIVVVADTRRVAGFLKYLSNLYNTDVWMFAIWAVVLTVVLGCTLGFLMDFIMERTGLDLKSRKIIEH